MQQRKWQTLMQNSAVLPVEFSHGQEQRDDRRYSTVAGELFSYRAPPAFMDKVDPFDPADPLLRQVLPVSAEENDQPGYTRDPLQEDSQQPVPGLLHKYHGRALLIVTGACAVHCRYCFRRHFPYAETNPSPDKWTQALDYLKNDTSISEVILSGGDPLTLADRRLSELLQRLLEIPHLRRLRIHSRIPIVLPERVNRHFISLLSEYRLPIVMVVHANHARELDDNVADASRRIRATNTLLLNQSVLLRGVNDSVTVLEALSERLFDLGILPYYLHLLDPVAGTAHFSVPENEARRIMRGLTAKLPGYLVPKLVREIAGEKSKRMIEPFV